VRLLALDTSTDICTVALYRDGATIERNEPGNRHSERILAMVLELLAESGLTLKQLDAIAFGRGPGSFTSLRIGAGVTQGLAFGADLPVVAISSLAALAQGVDAPRVLAAFDARMNQVYWGAYIRDDAGLMAPIGAEVVVAPPDVPLPPGRDWVGAGSGWDEFAPVLVGRLGAALGAWRSRRSPLASDVAALAVAELHAGRTLPADRALPVYIRDDVAEKAARPPVRAPGK
jgi:tRNA threonylcarbamoyladenosine biosynthesis protein TsaB